MPLGYDDGTGQGPVSTMGAPAGYGLGAFFSALANRGRNGQLAAQRGRMDALRGVLTEAQAYGEREQAKRAYTENAGLTDLEPALTAQYGPQLGHMLAVAARAKINPHELSQAALDDQGMGMRTAARDALAKGDYRLGNANLAAADGKPLQLSNESGGTVYNPYDLPGAPMATTAVGSSMIHAHNAAATASIASAADNYASAGEHRAKTQETLGTIPGKPVPLGLDGSQLKVLEAPVLDANGRPQVNPITGEPQMAVDPKRVGEFMTYLHALRMRNPRVTADEAVVSYAGGDERGIHDAVAELNKARAAVAAKRITREAAQARFRAAGYPQLADEL